MNYNDLYFIISIVLQLLIFFELRRQSKRSRDVAHEFLELQYFCILFFYCSVKYKTTSLFWYVSSCISYVPMECKLSLQKDSKMRDYLSFFYVKNYVIMML